LAVLLGRRRALHGLVDGLLLLDVSKRHRGLEVIK